MLQKFQELIKDLTKRIPSWDHDVNVILNDEEQEGIAHESLSEFTDVLKTIVKLANENDIPPNDVISLFESCESYEHVKVFVNKKMLTYSNFKVLRELEKKDLYKAKYCVDLLWSSSVLRFNPYMEFDKNIPIGEKDYLGLAYHMDLFIEMCVARHLCHNAILIELSNETGVSAEMCEYIADKIDGDFEKLKLNFIIDRLIK